MAITRSQQAKQLLALGGRIGFQGGGKDASQDDFGGSQDTGANDANTAREKGIMSRGKGPKGTTGDIRDFQDTGPDDRSNAIQNYTQTLVRQGYSPKQINQMFNRPNFFQRMVRNPFVRTGLYALNPVVGKFTARDVLKGIDVARNIKSIYDNPTLEVPETFFDEDKDKEVDTNLDEDKEVDTNLEDLAKGVRNVDKVMERQKEKSQADVLEELGLKMNMGGRVGLKGGADAATKSFTKDAKSTAKARRDDFFKGPGDRGEGPTFTRAEDVGFIDTPASTITANQAEILRKQMEEDRGIQTLNRLYRRGVDELPGVGLGSMAINALTPFRNFSLRKNIDYFKTRPKAVAKYGLSEEGYKNYMADRLAGKIDAAGNPLRGGDSGETSANIFTEFDPVESDMVENIEPDDIEDFLLRRFRAEGGIMGGLADGQMDEMGRQMYGLGKLVKKVTKTVKKIAKSPIGKAALLYVGTGGLGNLAAGKTFFGGQGIGGLFKPTQFLSNVPKIFSGSGLKNIAAKVGLGSFENVGGNRIFQKNLLGKVLTSPTGLITGASLIAGALTPQQEEEAQRISDETGIDIAEIRANPEKYLGRRFVADGGRIEYDEAGAVMSEKEMKKMAKSPLYKGFKTMYKVDPAMAKDNPAYKEVYDKYEQLFKKGFQKGGSAKEPVAKKVMPLLDLEGQEMDFRQDGGFVPIGRMEKADDVPARLSKNEFVFTADAVRNAGEGDIDKGAEVMYNMMKNLEAGGEVSEESQGLEGARNMFQTSKRLEEVL